MKAGDSINIILINMYINSLSLQYKMSHSILLKHLRILYTVSPNFIYKFLDHPKMFISNVKITSQPSLFHSFAINFQKKKKEN